MKKLLELSEPTSCLNKAGDDEIIFVLLSRDPAAPHAIAAWINERHRLGLDESGSPKLVEAQACAAAMMEQREPTPFVEAQGSGSERYQQDGDPYGFAEYMADSPHAKAGM